MSQNTPSKVIGSLESCPFCGQQPLIEPWVSSNGEMYAATMISCPGLHPDDEIGACAAAPSVTEDSRADAIAAWNTRVSTPPARPEREEIARLEAALRLARNRLQAHAIDSIARGDKHVKGRHAIQRGLRALSTGSPPVRESAKDKAISALRAYVESAGVPITEFDPEFVIRMMSAMMVSFHKYGRVAEAYPLKFNAADDVRARMSKYRQTGNKHYLVDAANFAMIEAMHPGRGAEWGGNDAADSPGRTTASGHRLIHETNDGTRIMGETILDIPGDRT